MNEDDLDDGMDFSEESDISISEMVCIDQAEGKMISPTQKLIDLLKMTPRFLHIKTDAQNDFLDEIMALNLTDCIQCEVKTKRITRGFVSTRSETKSKTKRAREAASNTSISGSNPS